MWTPVLRNMVRGMMVAATVAPAFAGADSRQSRGGPAEPRAQKTGDQPAKDDPDNCLTPQDLVWIARNANRQRRYDEAAPRARTATRRPGVGPDVLCAAWMNVFYAAHRTGDKDAATSALRSFDESAARLPASDPVVIEMNELKEALGLGGAVARVAVPDPPVGDGFWQSADPAALGLDVGAIGEHQALAKASGADAVLVAYRGKLVSEWYSTRYRTPAFTMSSIKMRNKGRWRGKSIVPEAWVEASTQPCPLYAKYGYLWWLIDDPKGFAAQGYLDTHCYIFPELELVIARIQARPYLFATEEYAPKALALFKRIVRK